MRTRGFPNPSSFKDMGSPVKFDAHPPRKYKSEIEHANTLIRFDRSIILVLGIRPSGEKDG